MRYLLYLISWVLVASVLEAQDFYDQAKRCFDTSDLDSARYFINKELGRKPTAEDYFLSALIHEANDLPLRAVADYEAVIMSDPNNIEAYFQKGLIYFNASSYRQALEDFTYVIDHIDGSSTKAIYFGIDPNGLKGTFLTTLQSMKSKVYQYRGSTYQELGDWDLALKDFDLSQTHGSTVELYVNRALLYQKMGKPSLAIADLKKAIQLEPTNYLVWYNLVLLDEKALLPPELVEDESFAPMMNLIGVNAYESKEYDRSIQYYSKALEINEQDDLSLIGRGKSFLKLNRFVDARKDFLKALQLNSKRTESLFLIGNSFFYEGAFEEATGFYEKYLSIDPAYEAIWYNAAMSYLSLDDQQKGCLYLEKAANLGMEAASKMQEEHCGNP